MHLGSVQLAVAPLGSPEPPLVVLLQVLGDAPPYGPAPTPQRQGAPRLHADGVAHLLEPPSGQHLHSPGTTQVTALRPLDIPEATGSFVPV